MATILDGKKVADSIYTKLLFDVSLLPSIPKLVVVLVGNDPASETYVRAKTKKAATLGLRSETLTLPSSFSEEDLVKTIRGLNDDKDVHGILVQLPLPKGIDRYKIMHAISPLKDVDGLHPENSGRLAEGNPRLVPCTAAGIIELLRFYSVGVEGKRAVIVGRSEIVGRPVAQLFLMHNATVTICHSKTRNLEKEIRNAEILIVAMGRPKFVIGEMVAPGTVVVDVGIHRTEDGLVGDVDFDSVAKVASAISPVPGGVGPLTIAMLMRNLVQAAQLKSLSQN
ncbi:MAG: bifunctional 5,10-methylenetetrahydrofolate dehydrogenase/5,10-methenyltetrahydrofolate cyclohydrolase [Deltaproteobacteria bacterium]|nr:bifunctional 5,10-methylenetetrahydrofolate dehydrogenase/5,10-methenyltetrahydrofolate cyclohydrolase [Deltaproteobacteria bacterium]MBI3293509.1 bifunctional 5,10-methylenetetrahydrofolate dehydrogenase/5,10-methenyltetrahydrofolate cyclohydrolase [Deltaproteobacteria bacterium]